jgi:hypothetical protein
MPDPCQEPTPGLLVAQSVDRIYAQPMPAVGELVRCTDGRWMVRPPLHCPRRAPARARPGARRSSAVLVPRRAHHVGVRLHLRGLVEAYARDSVNPTTRCGEIAKISR